MNEHIRRLMAASGMALVLTGALGAVAQGNAGVGDLYRDSYRLEAAGNARGALEKMVEVRAKAGPSYFVTVRSAWLAYATKNYDGAAQGYREASRLAPKAVEPRLGLSMVLLAQGKWRDLDRACRDVLQLDPSNAVARARLAHALYMVGNYPDSATTYRKLVEEYPAELDHRTGLGWSMMKMGRRAEARGMFAEVLAVSPDNASAKAGMSAQ